MSADRPAACEKCGRPHGKTIPIATNKGWFGKLVKVWDNGKQIEIPMWHDKYGKATPYEVGRPCWKKPTPEQIEEGLRNGVDRRDIRGDRINLKVSTEYVWLTRLTRNNVSIWVCVSCRADIIQRQKNVAEKKPEEYNESMFDLAAIDAQGKAKKEAKKKRDPMDMQGAESFYDG